MASANDGMPACIAATFPPRSAARSAARGERLLHIVSSGRQPRLLSPTVTRLEDLDDAENQSIRDRIQALGRRLEHRLAELEEHAAMDVVDPELVALAYVHGTAEPDVARRHGGAHHAAGHHLGDAVLEVGRPFSGYDPMIDRGNGHEFVTVARMTGTDDVELNWSEVIAARNLGPSHLLAVVDEDGPPPCARPSTWWTQPTRPGRCLTTNSG